MGKRASILFVGSPYWCGYLTKLLKRDQNVRVFTSDDILQWVLTRNRSICIVGLGAPDTYKRLIIHALACLMQGVGFIRRRVIYWIGSDVMKLRPGSRFVVGCTNIAGSSWLADEVRANGYSCEERLFPVELPFDRPLPFPETERLQVLCYVPDEHHDLHGSPEIRILVEHFSDIDFTIIGGAGTWWSECPKNIRFLGWVDDREGCLSRVHVLLRRTAHDSLSAFVREGLVAGRHVIFTYDIPGVVYVRRGDIAALLENMGNLNSRFSQGRLDHCTLDPDMRDRLTDTDTQLRTLMQDYD